MSLYLLLETEAREDGAGPVVETETATAETVVTLGITQALERQRLEVSIWGSQDGEHWGAKPLVEFPAKSYCGRYSIPLKGTVRDPDSSGRNSSATLPGALAWASAARTASRSAPGSRLTSARSATSVS